MPPNIWGQKLYMMAKMYWVYGKNHAETKKDFTRTQPAKPSKEIRKKLLFEASIPMLRESKACPHIKYKRIQYVYYYKGTEST